MLDTLHLMQALEAAGADHNVVYVSVPITSGGRELALMKELGLTSVAALRAAHHERWLHEVVRLNEREARDLAGRVRAADWARGSIVVDPSRMHIEGWDQDDYNAFWVELMARHVRMVVASPGWQRSRGARGEVGYALALGLDVVDTDGHPLDPAYLRACADAARRELLDDGWPPADVDRYMQPLNDSAPPSLQRSPQSQVFSWLVAERKRQVAFFGPARDDDHTRSDGVRAGGWWSDQLRRYWSSAEARGLADERGRADLARYVATAVGLLESVVRVHGAVPEPDGADPPER